MSLKHLVAKTLAQKRHYDIGRGGFMQRPLSRVSLVTWMLVAALDRRFWLGGSDWQKPPCHTLSALSNEEDAAHRTDATVCVPQKA